MSAVKNAFYKAGIQTGVTTGRIIEVGAKTAEIGADTVEIGAETIKVGAKTIKVGADTMRTGAKIALEVSEAVKNKAGNITKVGLKTGENTLKIASSTTGAVAALFGSIESRTERYKNNTVRLTEKKKKAGNESTNEFVNKEKRNIRRKLNLINIKKETNAIERIQKEKRKQLKLMEFDKKVIKVLLESSLIKLEELKDIVCKKISVFSFYKSKCKYTLKKYNNIDKYKKKITTYIENYQSYFDTLINLLDIRLKEYINKKNNNSKNKFEEIKKKIITETYEISMFLQLINYSIITIFSNANNNLNNSQVKELIKIYKMIDNDIKNRLNVKNLKQNNSLAEIISYQVKNNKRINNGLNTVIRINNGLNTVIRINNNIINNSQNNPKKINKILEEINLNNLSNNISNELNLTEEQIQNLSSTNNEKKYKVITNLIKNEKKRDILLKNKTIRSKLSNENIKKIINP